MGIRFYCPNGHKLNVKQFQAGQKAVCPVCGAKLEVPLESVRPNSHPKRSGKGTPTSAGVPEAAAAAPSPQGVAPAVPEAKATPPVAAKPNEVPPVATADPLTEAGGAVWFVRPPSGGQFGPATSDVMRSWLAEGRVSTDALVWREGWRDWQKAGSVFAGFAPKLVISGLEEFFAKPVATPVRRHPATGQAPKRRLQAPAIIGLAIAVVVLFTIFLRLVLR